MLIFIVIYIYIYIYVYLIISSIISVADSRDLGPIGYMGEEPEKFELRLDHSAAFSRNVAFIKEQWQVSISLLFLS